MTMPAAPLAFASWMKVTISPSMLLWRKTTSMPNRLAVARQSASTSAIVAVPYFSGSRMPSRFRFGPLRTWMVVAIDDPAAARLWSFWVFSWVLFVGLGGVG